MVSNTSRYQRVADLMARRNIDLDTLADATGVDPRVVEAIACQRYTPSPEHRKRVSGVLGVGREWIIWGHATAVEEHIHEPV